jgi:aspartyl-tRNA(Asn)/glutamyl-tRNA(Gln) amidotransferase subunit B
MPELPVAKRERYRALGLSSYDTLVLADDLGVSQYFDSVLGAGALPKPAANWVMGDVMAYCKVPRAGRQAGGLVV